METVRIQQNEQERVEAYFQNTGTTPLSGLTPTLAIRRQSDGAYWAGADFTSAFTQVTMSAVDAVNQGGFYSYNFDTTGLADGNYSLIVSGTGASNSPQIGELKVGGFIDNIDGSIRGQTSAGGGGTVSIQGVFSKKEKERLLAIISDNFRQVIGLLEPIAQILKDFLGRFDSMASDSQAEDIKRSIESISNYLEVQTDFIKKIEESKDLMEEINA